MKPLFLALWLMLLGPAAVAVQPDEVLPDPALEQRARAISAELRCLVCQNQSIDASDAPLARDLRLLVRERLAAGDSDASVRDFVVARYGEFVLLRPPLGPRTLLLWSTPFLLLLAALVMLWRRSRRLAAPDRVPPLTEAERARLAELTRD
jgi:cytochrome c-type biogenesis protein CcmH